MRLAVAWMLFVATLLSQRADDTVKRGMWSEDSISLFNTAGALDANPYRKISLPSPDGKKILRVEGEHVTLVWGGRTFGTGLGKRTNAEVGWSPDSSKLFVTWTDGGLTGTWNVEVFTVGSRGLRPLRRVDEAVRKDLDRLQRKRRKADWVKSPEQQQMWSSLDYCVPNVTATRWVRNERLIVNAFIPNSSGCRFMAEAKVYEVHIVSGKILRSYPWTSPL